jgi:hypothetical protein
LDCESKLRHFQVVPVFAFWLVTAADVRTALRVVSSDLVSLKQLVLLIVEPVLVEVPDQALRHIVQVRHQALRAFIVLLDDLLEDFLLAEALAEVF